MNAKRVFVLHPGVQHYAWGDPYFIPELLGIENAAERPCAELWMGAHPDLPTQMELGHDSVPLDQLIQQSPAEWLGEEVASQFGGKLPYLFKVLSAARPLSIQTHPTKREAERGYERENAAGLPLSDTERNYRDDNHKPELIVALTDFYGLRGFRPLPEIAELISQCDSFRKVASDFQPTPNGLRDLYERLMTLPQSEIDAILGPWIQRIQADNDTAPYLPSQREYWLLMADHEFSLDGQRDRGLFSIFLLNLVHLRPGEAMYLPAGVLHAYLNGAGVEIMANSNNVLRGGLTHKHVDVPELIRNVTFEGESPDVIEPRQIGNSCEFVYQTAAQEFELSQINLSQGIFDGGPSRTAEIVIVCDLALREVLYVSTDADTLTLGKGGVFLVPYGVTYRLATSGVALLYKASVPSA